MLLYNQRKEFIGVNEATLRRIGYNNIKELKEDVVDFADLFENRPGFVHNFKNFSWIDFILHSEQDDIKGRIRCNGKIYSCKFKIELFFFSQEEEGAEKGFAIELTDIQTIGDDDGSRPRELYEPEAPASMQMPSQAPTNPMPSMAQELISEPTSQTNQNNFDLPDINEPLSIEEPAPFPESAPEPLSVNMEPLEMPDLMMDTPPAPEPVGMAKEEPSPVETQTQTQTPKPAPATPPVPSGITLETPADYVFDPSIAADELGLPTDLIDEFVGDFVVQAKKFRPDIEEAIAKEDFDTVQILSHKLKGVAANLRIEDALEVLTFINSSKDVKMLHEYLKLLFVIVHKLEHGANTPMPEEQNDTQVNSPAPEPVAVETEPESELQPASKNPEPIQMEDDDLYNFDLVDDTPDLPEMEIPQPEPVAPTIHNEENSFNLQANAQLIGVDENTMKAYIHEFTDHANKLKTELEEALKSSNFETVKEIATELKGISETLHLDYASKRLETLQKTSDINEAIENAKELFVFIRQL